MRDNNIEFTIIEYLNDPPSAKDLGNICKYISISPIDLVRTYDNNFKVLKVDINNMNNDQILELLAKNPKILERPIIIKKQTAVIGRPPENVKKLF